MADQPTIKFPEGFDFKENPGYNDLIPIYDTAGGKSKKTSLEKIMAQTAANIIGTASPSSSPSGEETNGQSYRVSNTTDEDQTFTDFLDSEGDPVIVPSKKWGYLVKDSDSWTFLEDPMSAQGLMPSGGFDGSGQDLYNAIPSVGKVTKGNNVLLPEMALFNCLVISSTGLFSLASATNGWTVEWGIPLDPTKDFTIEGWDTVAVSVISGFSGDQPDLSIHPSNYNSQYVSKITITKTDGKYTIPANTFGETVTWIAFSIANNSEASTVYANLKAGEGESVTPVTDKYANKLNQDKLAAYALIDSEGNIYNADEIIGGGTEGKIKLTINPSSGLAGAVLEYQYKGDVYTRTLAPFRPWSHLDSNVFDYKDFTKNGEVVHSGVDAVCPIQIKNIDFLGNHAWTGMSATSAAHGKTLVDVGSKWTWQGLEVQIMAIIDGDRLLLSKTADNGSISTPGTVTHVAGATNTGSFAITASTAGRMCPSLKNRVINIFVDGVQIDATKGGIYYGQKIEFAESYLGLDKKSIHDWLFTQVGSTTEITKFDGTAINARTFVYTFYPDLTNVVPANEIALMDESSFQAYMMGQTQQLSGNVKICLPKTKPITWNGASTDFNLLTSIPSVMPGTITITGNDVLPDGIIADRMIQISDKIGFAMGVLPLFDQDENSRRLNAVDRALYISGSKKQYLVGLDRADITTRAKGDIFSYVFYKAYFPLQEGRTAKYVIEYGDSYYLYLLWHETITDHIELDGRLAGKSFDVLEKSDNVTVLTKIGGATLIADVEAEGSYGYLTLKFNK